MVNKVPKTIKCLVCVPANRYDPNEHMIIDTGCERMVSGTNHIYAGAAALEKISVAVMEHPASEQFSFGDNVIHNSTQRMIYPRAIRKRCFKIRQSVVELDNLPLLTSWCFMRDVGTVINTIPSTVSFIALGLLDVPLVIVPNGHMAIKIDEFPDVLPDMSDWPDDDNDFGGPPDSAARVAASRVQVTLVVNRPEVVDYRLAVPSEFEIPEVDYKDIKKRRPHHLLRFAGR